MSRISGNQTYNNNNNNRSSRSRSEQANASVSGVSTTATDLASAATAPTTKTETATAAAATFNRQRKRRKKKKDKLMLTNQQQQQQQQEQQQRQRRVAVNCSCGKRIESSCNSVSSCSNWVPTACVYCHFNELAYRENYSSSSLSRHRGDLVDDFTEKSEYKIDFRSSLPLAEIPPPPPPSQRSTIIDYSNNNNNDHIKSDIAAQSLAQNNYFMRHQRTNNNNQTDGINRHTDQRLQRFAIYENLCEFCGFAIGNGAYHLHCVADNKPSNIDQVKSENIYENICDLCHSIFDGEQCSSETCKTITKNYPQIARANIVPVPVSGEVIDVLVKKPPIANNNQTNRQFGKQFSEFLGSFKQKLTSKSVEGDRKRPKIEIIHNTDAVFKTNKTFDLNEIVQLKNQSSVVGDEKTTCVNASDVNACSEFKVDRNRNSIDLVTEVPLKPIRLSRRTSTSDSNFLEKYHRSSSSAAAAAVAAASIEPHFQTPFSDSIVSDTILYSNSYAPPSYEDAIQHSKYASVAPFKLRGHNNKSAAYDSTSASSFFTYNSSHSTQRTHSLEYNRKSPLVTSLLGESDDSVKQWLTFIEHEIHEYADGNSQFECGSMKCLPSKMLNESVNKLNASIDPVSDSSNKNMNEMIGNQRSNAHNITNLRHRIELFKENLLEHRMYSKRNAIYIKDSMFDAATAPAPAPDTIVPDIEIASATVDSTSLVPVCHHNVDIDDGGGDDNNNNESGVGVVLLRQKSQESSLEVEIAPIHGQPINYVDACEATSQYLQMLKAFYMTQVTLSTGLNRIVLVCGDRKLYFFVKYLVSQSHASSLERTSALVQPTKYTNVQQIIEFIQKMSVKNRLGDNNGKSAQITSNAECFNTDGCSDSSGKSDSLMVDDCFLKRSTNSPSRIPLRSRHKQTIDDYARRKQRTNGQQRQKVKTKDEPHTLSSKSLDDFATKNPDYSSTAMTTNEANTCNEVQKRINSSKESSPLKRDDGDDDESIYQPIWMFKTIGSANDTVAYENEFLNNFDTCENETNDNHDDDTTSHDAHEWEVAQEEFLFSSSHIDVAARNSQNSNRHSNQHMNHQHEGKVAAQLTEVKAKSEQQQQFKTNNSDKLQYQTICVLYNSAEPKWNEIIYDYNNNNNHSNSKTANPIRAHNDGHHHHTPIMDTVECNRSHEKNVLNDKISGQTKKSHEQQQQQQQRRQSTGQKVATIKLDSVNAWKSMLRTVDYLDDEEDVVSSRLCSMLQTSGFVFACTKQWPYE